MIKNLILDWSGTVVDDLDAVFRATNHVLRHHGADEITLEFFRRKFCLPWINFYKECLPHIPREGLDKVFWEVMLPEQETIALLPHALDFLKFAASHHMPVFVCSTVDPKSFWGQAERLGVTPFLKKAYVGVEDKREVIHQILKENQLDAVETMFVGDMLHDVETAKHGGVHACGVLTGFDPEEKLRAAKPDYLLRDLRELQLILESQFCTLDGQPVATVGALILNDREECLMVQTRKWGDKWGIPGGKIRRGETALEALRREILEETNLELQDIRFVMVQDCVDSTEFYRKAHFVLLNYIARTDKNEVILNEEAQNFRWISLIDALTLNLNLPTQTLLNQILKR